MNSVIVQIIAIFTAGLIIWAIVDFSTKRQKSYVEQTVAPMSGLGGWLFLIGYGLFSGLGGIANKMGNYIIWLGRDLRQNALILSDSLTSNDPIVWLTNIENAAIIIILLWFIPLLYLFLIKSISFPKVFIAFNVFIVLFVYLAPAIIKQAMPDDLMEDVRNQTSLVGFITDLIFGTVVITYMLISKRVKATFTRI